MKKLILSLLTLLCCSSLTCNVMTVVAQDLYVRGAHNNWAADAASKMTEVETGVYTISNITLTGAFKIADAAWSASANWGAPTGGSSLVVPGKPFTIECGSNPGNMTVEKTTVCQLITLNTLTSTLLIEEEPAPPAQVDGPALWPAQTVVVQSLPEKIRVLSMNNSLIHYENEWQDDMFNQLAAAMSKDAHWTAHTNLSKTLDYHYEEGEGTTEAGTPSARMLVRSEAWTHIILQEQTAKPRTNFAGFRKSVIRWVEYIRQNCPNPNAVIILPMNWAYNTDPFTEFNASFLKNYSDLAQELGLVVCPVGLAYQLAYNDGVDVLTSWFKDDRHPTQRSTYMAACLEYATIFGEDPTTITWYPQTLTDAVAEQMRSCARNAWQTYKQAVDQSTGCVHYQLRLIDTDGLSIQTLPADSYFTGDEQLADSTLCVSERGTYTVQATYGDQLFTATVVCDTAVTQVPEIDAIELVDAYTEDFNSLGVVERSTVDPKGMKHRSDLPFGWRIDRNLSAPRQVGSFFQATDTLMYFGGVSLASNAYNGTWNWGADDDEDRAIGGLTTGVDNGTRCINIMLAARNSSDDDMELTIACDIEKYRDGNNSAGFAVQLYYSLDGINWMSAGADFTSEWEPDAATQGYANVPAATRQMEGVLPVAAKAGELLFLAWNISVRSGTNCAGAPGLALDNVSIISSRVGSGNVDIIAPGKNSIKKIIRDGQILIIRDGVEYNLLGATVD